ncbi:MAG: hypothetical protein R3F20_08650 [Planctomycetota bacterium]
MNPLDRDPDLEALLDWAYGEADPETSRRIEARIASDPDFATEARALGATFASLDTWQPDAGALPAPSPVGRPRVARGTLRAAGIGAAAAILVFAGLFALAGRVEFGEGRAVLSLGASPTKGSPAAAADAVDREELRRFGEALHRWQYDLELDGRDLLQAEIDRLDGRQERRLLALALRIEDAMRRDREALATWLDRELEDGERRNRRLTTELVSRFLAEDEFPGERTLDRR